MKFVDQTQQYQKTDDGEWKRDEKDALIPATRPDGKPLIKFESYEQTEINWEVRLGAIYALERVAQDSKRDNWSIMETLAAYVRNNSPIQNVPAEEGKARVDIQAIIRVLGSNSRTMEEVKGAGRNQIDLSNSDLRQYIFQGKEYHYISFIGSDISHVYAIDTDLRHSSFGKVKAIGTSFSGTNLSRAGFWRMKGEGLNFYASDLTETYFTQSEFSGSHFDSCQFISSDLTQSRIVTCSVFECKFVGAKLDRMLIRESNLKANMFQSCMFLDCDFSLIDLSQCSFIDCIFRGCNLAWTTFPADAKVDRSSNFSLGDEWLEMQNELVKTELLFLRPAIEKEWSAWREKTGRR